VDWICSIGFEVLAAVVMKSSLFWDIMTLRRLTFKRLHSVISQKIEILIDNAQWWALVSTVMTIQVQ
jgi:hypothetical protein